MAPIDCPWRTLNAAMDFFARVTTGFWPVIWPSSLTAPWRYAAADPVPSAPVPALLYVLFYPLPFLFNFLSRFRSGYRFVKIHSSLKTVIYPMSFHTSYTPAPCDRRAIHDRYELARRSGIPIAHSKSISGFPALRYHP
jgi:hypothetical protein